MRLLALSLAGWTLALGVGPAAAQTPTVTQQIAAALLPLPPALRPEAAVVAFRPDGTLDTLRRGQNGMLCFADVPGDSLFDVRCYHEAFVSLIRRAGALRRAGSDPDSIDSLIAREVHDGRLKLPRTPTAGYRMYGPVEGYNPVATTVGDTIDQWQSVHIPFATAADLGVSETESGNDPYLMSAGTWWAHVMIMDRTLRY